MRILSSRSRGKCSQPHFRRGSLSVLRSASKLSGSHCVKDRKLSYLNLVTGEHVTTNSGAGLIKQASLCYFSPELFKMQRINSFKVLLALGCLQTYLFLVHGQASGTQCPTVPGQPGCVCDHPDGKIDLTAFSNNDGKPK